MNRAVAILHAIIVLLGAFAWGMVMVANGGFLWGWGAAFIMVMPLIRLVDAASRENK